VELDLVECLTKLVDVYTIMDRLERALDHGIVRVAGVDLVDEHKIQVLLDEPGLPLVECLRILKLE
jgi:hypothetical protein